MLLLRSVSTGRAIRAASTCAPPSCLRPILAEPVRYRALRRHRYCSCSSPKLQSFTYTPEGSYTPEGWTLHSTSSGATPDKYAFGRGFGTTDPTPDHRALGVQQQLFTTSIYSPGSPIFLPHGAILFNRLTDYLRREYVRYGFQEVITPTIYKKALWEKSGHLDNYAEDMYTVTGTKGLETTPDPANPEIPVEATEHAIAYATDFDRAAAARSHEYGLKPMNCPGHCLIFAAQRRSYRDLPIRYADFSSLHRDELSGALSGLTRVRRFHQDDGHIFCRPSQVESEIASTLDFIARAYSVFGLGPYRLVLSTRPTDGKLIGDTEDWDAAEAALTRALDKSGRKWTINEGDGAFYGPKIDVILTDSDGKEHQTATVQLDFQLPKRFELHYQALAPELERRGETTTDKKLMGKPGEVRPVMIHRAVLGSVERLMALLIENYKGKWPFWLNPRQVAILTVNDKAHTVGFATKVQHILKGTSGAADGPYGTTTSNIDMAGPFKPTGLTVDVDASARTVKLKVLEARKKGYGVIIVVGSNNIESGRISPDMNDVPAAMRVDDGAGAFPTFRRFEEGTPEQTRDYLLGLVENYD